MSTLASGSIGNKGLVDCGSSNAFSKIDSFRKFHSSFGSSPRKFLATKDTRMEERIDGSIIYNNVIRSPNMDGARDIDNHGAKFHLGER